MQLIFWFIHLHRILRILNKRHITISHPLIILNIRHPLVDFFEARQRVSAYEAILTYNGESAIMLSKYQSQHFSSIDPDLLHFLEGVRIVDNDVAAFNYEEILATCRVLDYVDGAQFYLTCLLQVVIHDVMNQNLVYECYC